MVYFASKLSSAEVSINRWQFYSLGKTIRREIDFLNVIVPAKDAQKRLGSGMLLVESS
jgi:hypothetical protein